MEIGNRMTVIRGFGEGDVGNCTVGVKLQLHKISNFQGSAKVHSAYS